MLERIGMLKKQENQILEDENESVSIKMILNLFSNIITPYVEKIQNVGLKKYIEQNLVGVNINRLFLNTLKKHLSASRNIKLGSGMGRASIQYRNNKIQINITGAAAFVINEITITDDQIIAAVDDVIRQFQSLYIDDLSYINMKIEEVLKDLSKTGIYKPKTSEEKTFYDLVLLMLIRKYKGQKGSPKWLSAAIDKLERNDVIKDLLSSIVDQVTSVAENISENLYLNLKLTLDSGLLRITLNRKTNNGQIAGFFKMFGIDIDKEIDAFVEEYMTPSFVNGMGEIVIEVVNSVFFETPRYGDNQKKKENCSFEPFQITMTKDEEFSDSRAFRWFAPEEVDEGVLEYSESENLENSIKIEAKCKRTMKPETIFSLGLLSLHKTKIESEFSAKIEGLKEGKTYWYRVGSRKFNSYSKVFSFKIPPKSDTLTFLNIADSQGMVKSDYDTFLKVFDAAVSNVKNIDFVSHLGDFVDDGNNEDYWDYLLSGDMWKKYPIVPLAGNHEARVKRAILDNGGENSILRHFNLKNIPCQDMSTGAYYSFEYKNAVFVILNTNDIGEEDMLSDKQCSWAIESARNSKAKWRILLTHKAPYSNGPHCDDADVKRIKPQIEKICSDGEFDLVLSGHDHVYVRTPILKNKRKTKHKTKILEYEGIQYETAVDPDGALFVVPGTSGVKNYRQDLSAIIPGEVIDKAEFPIYSKIVIDKSRLYFTAYRYDIKTDKSYVFDSYAIEKNNENRIPKLEEKANKNINEVKVHNRLQFINAVKNPNVQSIITSGKDLRLGTIFGVKKFRINRDLIIRGSSRLIHVEFVLKDSSKLTFDDDIFIDNSRKQKSLYPSITTVRAYDNSSVILKGNSLIKSEYGYGKNSVAVALIGNNSEAIFKSSSEQWCENGVVYSENSTSKVSVFSGKISSRARYYAIESCGEVIVNGGRVKNICINKGGKLYLNDGIIGSSDNHGTFIPIRLNGKAYIMGGQVLKRQNKSIVLEGKDTKMYLAPIYKGTVNIAGIFPFAGLKIENNKPTVSLYGSGNCVEAAAKIYQSDEYIWDIAETLDNGKYRSFVGDNFAKTSYFAKLDCTEYFDKIICRGKSKVYLISNIKSIY